MGTGGEAGGEGVEPRLLHVVAGAGKAVAKAQRTPAATFERILVTRDPRSPGGVIRRIDEERHVEMGGQPFDMPQPQRILQGCVDVVVTKEQGHLVTETEKAFGSGRGARGTADMKKHTHGSKLHQNENGESGLGGGIRLGSLSRG